MVFLRCLDLVFHAITFAVNDHGFSVMQKPVQHGAGQRAVVVEDFGPVFIGLVGGQQDGALLIALADDLKEQVGADLVDGQIAYFIDGQDSGLEVTLEFGFEPANDLGGGKRVDDVHGGGEQHRVSAQTGFMGQGHDQVCFPEADSAHEDDVGFVFGEGQAKEVLHLGAIDFLGPVPVELVQRFEAGETGGGHAALDGQLLAALGFAVNEPGQIINVGPLFLRGLGGQDCILLGHRDEFEGG